MNATIKDNVLPANVADDIAALLMGPNFPWFYHEGGVVYENSGGHYMTHLLYIENKINSEFFGVIEPLLAVIQPRSIYRIKANLYPPTETIIEHGFHTDYQWDDIHTAVYYVNTNNGYTALSDGTRIDSVKNRLAILEPLVPHTSSTSTETGRVTINFNWF